MQSHSGQSALSPFPLFKLPPPLMFALAFGVGALVQFLVPVTPVLSTTYLFDAGAVLASIGVCLALSAASIFLVRRTTLNPFAVPSTFVARGPYRFTRNPMYVSLVIVYLGAVLMLGSFWPLIMLAAPIAILNRVVIPFEENQLVEAFGDSYQTYRSKVRRWL